MSYKRLNDTLARQSDVTVSTNSQIYGEYKGFFIHVLAMVSFICFVLWSLVPDFILENLGIDYLPGKYWSIAIPSYSLILMLYIYVALSLYNSEVLTLPLNDVRNFIDHHTVLAGENNCTKEELLQYVHDSPSGVRELPISLVNEVLYTQADEDYEDDTDESEID